MLWNRIVVMMLVVCFGNELYAQQDSMELLDESFMLKESIALEHQRDSTDFDNRARDKEKPPYQSITLAHTNSLLYFEGFEVTFSADGTVKYQGSNRTKLAGEKHFKIHARDYMRLCRAVRRLELDKDVQPPSGVVWDSPVTIVRTQLKDGSKITVGNKGDYDRIEFELLRAYVEKLLKQAKDQAK